MNSTVVDRTDVVVSRLSFGTGSLHHRFHFAERQRLLADAAASGISHFDTSPYYGYGLAEIDLGRFLQGQRSRFTLTTKVGLYPWGRAAQGAAAVWARKAVGKFFPRLSQPEVDWSVQRARESLRASLRRLRTDRIDFLMIHEPDCALLDTEEFLRWMEAERALGTVRYWGLAGEASNLRALVSTGHPLAQVIQTRDSLVKREANFVLEQDRELQFTYGYLSASRQAGSVGTTEDLLREALKRNPNGSVIISTRRIEHLAMLARSQP